MKLETTSGWNCPKLSSGAAPRRRPRAFGFVGNWQEIDIDAWIRTSGIRKWHKGWTKASACSMKHYRYFQSWKASPISSCFYIVQMSLLSESVKIWTPPKLFFVARSAIILKIEVFSLHRPLGNVPHDFSSHFIEPQTSELKRQQFKKSEHFANVQSSM